MTPPERAAARPARVSCGDRGLSCLARSPVHDHHHARRIDRAGYDMREAAISDLGVSQQTAVLFNLSLVVVGVLNIAGGFLLYRAHRRAWIMVLFTIAGCGPSAPACSR